jgi:type IV fimbrial biogenesis protein FimT
MRFARGVSLVELMIGLAIAGLLLAAGAPAFTRWIQNAQNRAAAEAVLSGLQLARSEAVMRNTLVRFQLTDGSGMVNWNVGCVVVTPECPASIQRRNTGEGARNARVGVSTAAIPHPAPPGYFSTPVEAGSGLAAGVSFDGMGRPLLADVSRIDITNAASSEARRYVVTIAPGGQIRMCDPALAFSTNPQGCS